MQALWLENLKTHVNCASENEPKQFRQRMLANLMRGTVRLTSCLIGLDLTKQVKLLLRSQHQQRS